MPSVQTRCLAGVNLFFDFQTLELFITFKRDDFKPQYGLIEMTGSFNI